MSKITKTQGFHNPEEHPLAFLKKKKRKKRQGGITPRRLAGEDLTRRKKHAVATTCTWSPPYSAMSRVPAASGPIPTTAGCGWVCVGGGGGGGNSPASVSRFLSSPVWARSPSLICPLPGSPAAGEASEAAGTDGGW